MTFSLRDLDCEVSAPARARRWAAERLQAALPHRAVAQGLVDDAVLCVSELVTNAVEAGCTSVTLRVDADDESVRVSLVDDAPGRPEPRASGPQDLRGRGLKIIGALSRAWGVDPVGSGKEVWVELGCTA